MNQESRIKNKIIFVFFITMCYSQLFYAQTASFTADQLYRIQNVNGYADLGSANLPTITSYFDPLSGTFVTHTLYPIGPLHFYQFRTNKYGFSFEKNILSGSGKFTSPGSELSLNFSTSPIVGSSPPTITPALLIKRNLGQVGIGYSSISPINSKLDITNNSDVISTFKTTSFFTTDIQIANLFKVNRPNTKALVINNSSTAKNMFIVKGNGQTQIGEKSGNGKHLDAMLSVYGKVVARSFYVTIDPALWADYVFDPNYKLKPLKEVEEFYLIKKHLPDVPDANEISKSDLNLAEMQTIQMRKIEELTLYIVELNKQLEVLQTKIKQLENQ